MLFGPRDFPDFRAEIVSDISKGTEGVVKKELPNFITHETGKRLVGSWHTFGDMMRNIKVPLNLLGSLAYSVELVELVSNQKKFFKSDE